MGFWGREKFGEMTWGQIGDFAGWIVVSWVFCTLARFLMVGVLYWPLQRLGMTAEKLCLVAWTGIRGATSLALSMIILEMVNDSDEDFLAADENTLYDLLFIFMHVGGVTFLNALVQAPLVS